MSVNGANAWTQSPVGIAQSNVIYQLLLWVIYPGTVRAPGRAVHFGHA